MNIEKPELKIIAERQKLVAEIPATIDILLRLAAPDAVNDNKRPRLNLSLVIDRSGSMQGRKIIEAREAAKYCIDQLLPADRISAVIFDSDIDILIPSQPVENKELLKRAINSVQTSGSTNLHGAWNSGTNEVARHLNNEAINRVLLITDGQANVGETRSDRLADHSRRAALDGVSTSTIGIGRDFSEDLLLSMAETGQGNAWHVQEPDDMRRIFETELRGLVNQFAHSVKMTITTADGVTVEDILNDFQSLPDQSYDLPNLRSGSPLEIVVRLKLPALPIGTSELARFEISYTNQQTTLRDSVNAVLAAEFASPEEVAELPANSDVAEVVQLLMNARARQEMIGHMDAGNFDRAYTTLKSVLADTDVMFSLAPSPRLEDDLVEFDLLSESIKSRDEDIDTRKKLAYQREQRRKSK